VISPHDPREDEEGARVRHGPENRGTSPSKLRRDRRHCPVCLVALGKNATRTRRKRCCETCGAHPQPGKSCVKCGADAIWQGRGQAACRHCGAHGAAAAVIASPDGA
jgi:hypothetical protein